MSRNKKIEVPFFLPVIDDILLLKKKYSKEKPICESNKNFITRIHGILDEICKSQDWFIVVSSLDVLRLEGVADSLTKDCMLVVDCPERNLHPRRQRMVARLCAVLANNGVNIVMTTNSDYIIKELNTLLMINFDKRSKELGLKKGYQEDEMLDAKDVNLFIAKSETDLEKCAVSQDVGMTVESFDDEIRDMGVFQRELLYKE